MTPPKRMTAVSEIGKLLSRLKRFNTNAPRKITDDYKRGLMDGQKKQLDYVIPQLEAIHERHSE